MKGESTAAETLPDFLETEFQRLERSVAERIQREQIEERRRADAERIRKLEVGRIMHPFVADAYDRGYADGLKAGEEVALAKLRADVAAMKDKEELTDEA